MYFCKYVLHRIVTERLGLWVRHLFPSNIIYLMYYYLKNRQSLSRIAGSGVSRANSSPFQLWVLIVRGDQLPPLLMSPNDKSSN